MKTSQISTLRAIAISVLTMVAISACISGKETDKEQALQLPPESSMVMDFSAFTGASARLASRSSAARVTSQSHNSPLVSNYAYAAANVGIWSVVLAANLALPVAAFREAFYHMPKHQADGSWIWSYTVNVAGIVYVISLNGVVVGSNANWAMYVTKEGVYENYLWFTGVSALDRSGGTWSLNYSVADAEPQPFIDITWAQDTGAGTQVLRFTSQIAAGGIAVGDYVEYAVTGSSPYDAYFHLSLGGNLAEVEWNRTTKEGRVQDPAHYNAAGWYCWDGTQADDISTPGCTVL